MTQEDEDRFRNINTFWFCENDIYYKKNRCHCHLRGKYRGRADEICKLKKLNRKKSHFIPLAYDIFSNYECHLIFENNIVEKTDNVELRVILKNSEEYISVS